MRDLLRRWSRNIFSFFRELWTRGKFPGSGESDRFNELMTESQELREDFTRKDRRPRPYRQMASWRQTRPWPEVQPLDPENQAILDSRGAYGWSENPGITSGSISFGEQETDPDPSSCNMYIEDLQEEAEKQTNKRNIKIIRKDE